MRIVGNDPLYARNARLGFYANVLGALLILAAAYTLFAQEQPSLGVYFGLLLGGIVVLQIGLYFGRWARRPDQALNQALKGLEEDGKAILDINGIGPKALEDLKAVLKKEGYKLP